MTGTDENSLTGHTYPLDKDAKPQLCANCTHTVVCTLPAIAEGYGCIYYDAETQFAVDEIVNGFEDMLARRLKDLSVELGKQGMTVAEVDIVQHEYISFSTRGNEITNQMFTVGVTTKTKRVKG